MNVKFGRVVLAMILALTLDAVAKTVAWYRFDDFAPGTVTASGDTFANSAENSNVPAPATTRRFAADCRAITADSSSARIRSRARSRSAAGSTSAV